MFEDRADAGRQLAKALKKYGDKNVVVLAVPRGGVAVAVEVANALGAPLDIVIVRKVGVPYQPELAMGAVMDGSHPVMVRNDDVVRLYDISEEIFRIRCEDELQEIDRRRALYFEKTVPVDVAGRTVILVDDGIATGASVRVAIAGLKQRNPRKLILAVPVGAAETMEELRHEVDEVVCLKEPAALVAIGFYYKDFAQMTDEQVITDLASVGLR